MSVTITINVSQDAGAAEVRTGAEVTGEAPPPTLLGGPSETAAKQVAKAAAEGPPPLKPEELGLGAATETTADIGPLPREYVEGKSETDISAEAPEPMPIEELEKPEQSTRKKS